MIAAAAAVDEQSVGLGILGAPGLAVCILAEAQLRILQFIAGQEGEQPQRLICREQRQLPGGEVAGEVAVEVL